MPLCGRSRGGHARTPDKRVQGPRGAVLLGAQGTTGRVAGTALGAHLGLQPPELHQHSVVQAQADVVRADWTCGRLDRPQDAHSSGVLMLDNSCCSIFC